MRAFQHYDLHIGTKIPFQDWPSIVLTFLNDLGLHHRQLLYYFSDYDYTERSTAIISGKECKKCRASEELCSFCRETARKNLSRGTGCHKAAKEHPQLGSICEQHTPYNKIVYLSNINTSKGCPEDVLLPLMPKLYRRYGFVDSVLIFDDVDFFSRQNSTCAHTIHNCTHVLDLPGGSYIKLHRNCGDSRDNMIHMVIDVTGEHRTHDASSYRAALAKYLPGIKCSDYTSVELSPEEHAAYQACNLQAAPFAAPLIHREPEVWEPKTDHEGKSTQWSPGPILKKLVPQHGYTYLRKFDHLHYFYKRDTFGHLLKVELDAQPGSGAFCAYLHYSGPGFCHKIPLTVTYRAGKEEFRDFIEFVFAKIRNLEESVLLQIGALYPPTPLWFIESGVL